MNVEIEKSRAWTGTLYPENMIDNWEDEIANIIQLPCVYAIHDKDVNNDSLGRKVHVHLMVIWRNNTTNKAALQLFNRLSGTKNKCCPFVEKVILFVMFMIISFMLQMMLVKKENISIVKMQEFV